MTVATFFLVVLGLPFFLYNIVVLCDSPTCRNEVNSAVDWFMVYKLPNHKNNGSKQMYMDSNMKKWKMLDRPIDTTNHPIFYTLQQVYLQKQNMYAMYNDQYKKPKMNMYNSASQGHMKGFLSFDKNRGFWVIHSLPHFPDNVSYVYPSSGYQYGQTFLCISMPYKNLDKIGQLLLYGYPHVYSKNFPSAFSKENPNMGNVLQGEHIDSEGGHLVSNLNSLKGQQFTIFAKNRLFGDDLYSGLVAPTLRVGLQTETWLHGNKSDDMPSNCTIKYKVENIKQLNLLGYKIKNGMDHAKWAVSKVTGLRSKSSSNSKPQWNGVVVMQQHKPVRGSVGWICIGDINRQYTQNVRGGGTACLNDVDTWSAFNQLIVGVDKCNK